MKGYSTGSSIVDEMASINLTGNVIPQTWYRTITKESGKPYLLAIAIMSDIVYWYRPQEVRDEGTGQIIGYRKKIHDDLLQRSYDQFSDMFGESKRCVTEAIVRLEKLGLIKRVFRTIEVNGMRYNNVLYIELFPDRLYDLTYPDTQEGSRIQKGHTLSLKKGRGGTQKSDRCLRNGGDLSPKKGRQNTKNTTEITTEITSSSPKVPLQDEAADDDDDIKTQVGYQRASKEYPTIARIALEELVKDNNRKLPITENMFLSVCRNVSEHSGEIANVNAYIGTCLNNIVAGHEISKSPPKRNAFSHFNQTKYSDTDWEQLEEQLLAN